MIPGTTIGRYVVKRKLAEGGMAEILLCAVRGPEGFEKEVVLKRIRSNFAADPGFVQMFVAEARVVSRLHHPNIVQVFDFDQHDDSYYLAMEYVRGRALWDLRKRCRELGTAVPPVLSAFMAAEVARALDHAHGLSENGERLGLVHRDVTPHNVLLSFDGAVKLADFGIVKSNAGLTAPGTLKGKLAYMSPEQARGEPVDARTDVFALGIVLWELLTGGRLFEGGNEIALLRAVQESAIAPPSRLNPDVPPALSHVVERALERKREARFQAAAEMERALREVLLAHARTVEDTDVGAFLRRMFPEATEPGPPPSLQALRDQATAPGRGPAQPQIPASRREGRGRAQPELPPPPTAAEAPTLVVRPVEEPAPDRPVSTGPPQLGMKQALGISGAAVLAGAALAAAVGLWLGNAPAPAGAARAASRPGATAGTAEGQGALPGGPSGGVGAGAVAPPASAPGVHLRGGEQEGSVRPARGSPAGGEAATGDGQEEARRGQGTDGTRAPRGASGVGAAAGENPPGTVAGPPGAAGASGGGLVGGAASIVVSGMRGDAAARDGAQAPPGARRMTGLQPPRVGVATGAGGGAAGEAQDGPAVPGSGAPAASAADGAAPPPASGDVSPGKRQQVAAVAPGSGVATAGDGERAATSVRPSASTQRAGTLQLRVVPWAQAWLDGKPLGEVGPQRDFSLPPGDHQLRLEHPRGTRQLSVRVKPDEITALALDMLAP